MWALEVALVGAILVLAGVGAGFLIGLARHALGVDDGDT